MVEKCFVSLVSQSSTTAPQKIEGPMPTEHLIQSTHTELDLLKKVIWLNRQLVPQTVSWLMEQCDINTLSGEHVVHLLHLCGP